MLNRKPIVDDPEFFENTNVEKLLKINPENFNKEEAIIIAKKLFLFNHSPINPQEEARKRGVTDTLYNKILHMFKITENELVQFKHAELYNFFKNGELEELNKLINAIFSEKNAESAKKIAADSSETILNILTNQTQMDEARKTTLTILLDCYNEILKPMQKEEKLSQPVTPKKPFEPSIDISQLNFETAGQVIVEYAQNYKKINNEAFDLPTAIAIVESLREQKADHVFENDW